MFDVQAIRDQFPILQQQVHDMPLVYLDSAATSQKPQCVIDAVRDYYEKDNANIHRSVHELAARSTHAYEQAREVVSRFLGGVSKDGVVFVRGATEGINLIANSWGRSQLQAGDRVLISYLEHHANIVPWQMICKERGAHLDVIPMDETGQLDQAAYLKLLEKSPKMVACTWVSNALGTITPIKEMIAAAKAAGAKTLVDACQMAPHGPMDVAALGCDAIVFSGHKTFAPTGIGALWAKPDWLDILPPYQGGGDMIEHVTFEETRFAKIPMRFEAGTPNIAGAVGLAAALEWMMGLNWSEIAQYEQAIVEKAHASLQTIPGLRLLGPVSQKMPVFSFSIEGVPAYDLAHVLDRKGIAIRTGHHCAQPVHDFLGVPQSARASFSVYNTLDEIDLLTTGILNSLKFFT